MIQSTRRAFLLATAVAVPAMALMPRWSAAAGNVLRVIPHADLKNLDPIWTTAYISRNHGYLVYDTLFALDENLEVQPQIFVKPENHGSASILSRSGEYIDRGALYAL